MLFVRRSLYYFFSGLLFALLVATAWSAALTITFSNPAKPEMWLGQSGFYDHFVAYAIQQTQKNQSGQGNVSADVALSNPQVQQAVQTAFTPQVVQNAVDTILNANYDWLEGKTAAPSYSIDLSQPKAAMADNLSSYAETKAASLPACTPAQTLQILNTGATFDVFSATCLPSGVTPAAVAQTVKQDALTNQNFLPNPVITPQNLYTATGQTNPAAQAYYVTLKRLPLAYQWATRLPWILGGASLLCAVVVAALAGKLRKGLRRVATVLIAAGVVILALILLSNALVHRLETHVFSGSNVGQLQASLTDFMHRAQSALVKIDIWFAAGFALAGLLLYLLLILTRSKPRGRAAPPRKPNNIEPAYPATPQDTPPTTAQSSDGTTKQQSTPRPPKPPTLIQL